MVVFLARDPGDMASIARRLCVMAGERAIDLATPPFAGSASWPAVTAKADGDYLATIVLAPKARR
jgi:hypothetical protein